VEIGLKYVHNDACYPSILVVGQLIGALQSGRYDLNRTALMITQTGGGCRATNYIAFLRKALEDAGLGHVPVISLNALGLEEHPGFTFSAKMLKRSFQALVYGDLLMRVLLRTRPYEVEPGSAERLYRSWVERCMQDLAGASSRRYHRNLREIVRDFDTIPLREEKKPRIGLVGEILVKFHPTANNEIIKIVEREGAEAVVPDFLDFFLYTAHTGSFKASHLSGTRKQKLISRAVVGYIERYRRVMRRALQESRRFEAPPRIEELEERTRPVISAGAIMGEGWFLTGEMIELIEEGADNVVCMQPFACLPNQITGKGMIRLLKKRYPEANIAAIDYDPGASEVNQLNRIKLMLSVAFRKLKDAERALAEGEEPGFVAGAPREELPDETDEGHGGKVTAEGLTDEDAKEGRENSDGSIQAS
jgi:predicted nucleotide-binding protein (sugar kinase/HSP70/actin superfamily)